MKFLRKIINDIIGRKTNVKHLGRWNIDYCDTKMKKKVELSNEDHCGPCGSFMMSKQIEKKIENQIESPVEITKLSKPKK